MAEDLKNDNVEKNAAKNTDSLANNESIQQVIAFFKKYQMYFGIAIAAILLFVVYKQFFGKKVNPIKELNAEVAMYGPLQKMQMDSFNLALNGDTAGQGTEGLLSIIKKNKGTSLANQAKMEAAVCYLKTDKPKEALKLLEDVSGFGKQINARKLSLMGDAKSEIGTENGTVNNKICEEAIGYYEKAANEFTDDDLAGGYLIKAGELYEVMGKVEEAKKIFEKIKEKYPNVQTALVEKLLGKLGVIN
jgi:tetratricopeptide (TPR) repeat protein